MKMISDMNLFLDEAKNIKVKSQNLQTNVTLAFSVSKLTDKGEFKYEHERHEVTLFLTPKQLVEVFEQINEVVPKVFRDDQCGLCAGSGTMPVSDGQTSWSGDDPCPNCDPINYRRLYPVEARND